MAISLSPEVQKLLEERVKNGGYRSADEVVVAALDALNDREALAPDNAVLDAIDEAEDQIDRGDVREWKDVRDEVRAKFTGK